MSELYLNIFIIIDFVFYNSYDRANSKTIVMKFQFFCKFCPIGQPTIVIQVWILTAELL